MWAQATITFKNTLNQRTFLAGLPPACNTTEVLQNTSFVNTPQIINNILYAYEGPTEKLILFNNGACSLLGHILPKTIAPDLGRIKDQIEKDVSLFFDAAWNSNHQIKDLKVGIAFEEEVILMGSYQGKWARVGKKLRDGILGDVTIGIMTFVAALVFKINVMEALPIGIAALLGLCVWLAVLAIKEKEQINYEER